MSPEQVQFFSIGTVILDDIVTASGERHAAVLGGGATHAAMGMRVWSQPVGLLATVGADLPLAHRRALEGAFEPSGIFSSSAPTPRAWQLYDSRGERREVFQTDFEEMVALIPRPEDLPEGFHRVGGVHLHAAAPEPLRAWSTRLRAAGCGCLLWEPWEPYCRPENRGEIRELLALVDVFSPALPEARVLTGREDPPAVARALLEMGAPRLALRMGGQGSLACEPGSKPRHIPAAPVKALVDPTGAGNAYCGGFLVGLVETDDLAAAAAYGTVSAWFALEHLGAVFSAEGLRGQAEARLSVIRRLAGAG
jgi:sugar/nucleoside kinase (ribokinase family)